MKTKSLLVAAGLTAIASLGYAQTEQSSVQLDAVVVEVAQPGPPLWKVSKGDHVLWIMGVYGPIPKKMEWRSRQVEDVIAASQAVISSPGLDVDVGFFKGLFLLRKWKKAQANPNGEKLETVLAPPLYERYAAAKLKFSVSNKTDKLRPSFAAQALYQAAYESVGLKGNSGVYDRIVKAAKKNKVPLTVVLVKIEDPGSYLSEVDSIPVSTHAECLRLTLDRIDTDLPAMRARANAWAIGDMDAIRRLPYVNSGAACSEMNARATTRFAALYDRQWPQWHEAVDAALANNRSTFTYIALPELLDPNGPLSVLRSKGYKVEEP